MPPSDLPTGKTSRRTRPIRQQSAPISLYWPRPLHGRPAAQCVTLQENDPAECIPAHSPAQSGILRASLPEGLPTNVVRARRRFALATKTG